MTPTSPTPSRVMPRWRKACGRLLALAARPVRKSQGTRGTVIEAYRGYGSRDEIFLIGRVFRQAQPGPEERDDDLATDLRDIARRIRRRKVAGAAIVARFGGAETIAVTDCDGYFRIALRPQAPASGGDLWHAVDLELVADPPVLARGKVFIPPGTCRFGVISDIDDTIMHTGVANKLKMLWRLFVADAEDRVAFPGAAALCRALHAGPGGNQSNPMLYVSRAPWGIYDMLTEFFRQHAIPEGPVLFLREWGLSWRHPLPRRAEDHKRDVIRHMLALYADLPFVMIGDSGQHDPEVYARIISENPGRVLAVYIRNVSRDEGRAQDIERLSRTILAAGSSLVLAPDTATMADHALALGLIHEAGARAILAECGARDTSPSIEPVVMEPESRPATEREDPGGSTSPARG